VAGEFGDEPAGDGGCDQGLPPIYDADGGDELVGRVVLEHEAARARAERLVDVLVEVEGREDRDARLAVWDCDDPARGREPVEHGHTDISEDPR
jgi:hypothetical protein